jgi:DNA-directed RNA polymerase specialized sigma24 family protein
VRRSSRRGRTTDLVACPGFITDLVLRSGRGDAGAFAGLLDLLYAPVAHRVAELSPERGTDDVVVEVFTRLWRDAPGYRPGDDAGGPVDWVLRIAENVAVPHRAPAGC